MLEHVVIEVVVTTLTVTLLLLYDMCV